MVGLIGIRVVGDGTTAGVQLAQRGARWGERHVQHQIEVEETPTRTQQVRDVDECLAYSGGLAQVVDGQSRDDGVE